MKHCLFKNMYSSFFQVDLSTASQTPNVSVALYPTQETVEIREGSSLTINCTVSGLLSDLQIVIYKDQVKNKYSN